MKTDVIGAALLSLFSMLLISVGAALLILRFWPRKTFDVIPAALACAILVLLIGGVLSVVVSGVAGAFAYQHPSPLLRFCWPAMVVPLTGLALIGFWIFGAHKPPSPPASSAVRKSASAHGVKSPTKTPGSKVEIPDSPASNRPDPEMALGSDPQHPAPLGGGPGSRDSGGLANLDWSSPTNAQDIDEMNRLAGSLVYPGADLMASSKKYMQGSSIPWPGITYFSPNGVTAQEFTDWYEQHFRGGYRRGNFYYGAGVRPGDHAPILIIVNFGLQEQGNRESMAVSFIDPVYADAVEKVLLKPEDIEAMKNQRNGR